MYLDKKQKILKLKSEIRELETFFDFNNKFLESLSITICDAIKKGISSAVERRYREIEKLENTN